jgi:hypothetical protein
MGFSDWISRPEAVAAACAAALADGVLGRSPPARHNGVVCLYRDEASVLRTHELRRRGFRADRIITLPTLGGA